MPPVRWPRSAALALALGACGVAEGRRDAGSSVDGAIVGDGAVATDAPSADASIASDAPDAAPPSRCEATPERVTCTHETRVYRAASVDREVHYQVPSGPPPADGFPAVLMFQGSFLTADRTWSAVPTDPFGMFHQTLLVKALLDAGYAVITPEAQGDGSTYWDTNIPPYATFWESAPDHQLMLALLDGIERGELGAIDASTLFATGISSGGYMTSRMAVSYAGRFRALAIQSASYATCGGTSCSVPADLPDDHPPTLFLHGGLDTAVLVSTMEPYEAGLRAQGTTTRRVVDPAEGHTWLEQAPEEVLAWFDARR